MNEVMQWGMQNMWQEDVHKGAYAVRYGNVPVSDFGRPHVGEVLDHNRPNFFEKAFPTLYPYGVGGIERDQANSVSFIDHV